MTIELSMPPEQIPNSATWSARAIFCAASIASMIAWP